MLSSPGSSKLKLEPAGSARTGRYLTTSLLQIIIIYCVFFMCAFEFLGVTQLFMVWMYSISVFTGATTDNFPGVRMRDFRTRFITREHARLTQRITGLGPS